MTGKMEKISLRQMTFDEGTGGLPALEKHFHPRDIGAGEHPPYGNPFLPRGCQVSLRVRHDENLLGGGIQFLEERPGLSDARPFFPCRT